MSNLEGSIRQSEVPVPEEKRERLRAGVSEAIAAGMTDEAILDAVRTERRKAAAAADAAFILPVLVFSEDERDEFLVALEGRGSGAEYHMAFLAVREAVRAGDVQAAFRALVQEHRSLRVALRHLEGQ